ncbi:hypothetical protein [Thiolapillus sp.]|uniref:hypothetical protein n=1 Tax=Thiolapillus sp. TaxID=2017437 RepID=UPI003AF5A85E
MSYAPQPAQTNTTLSLGEINRRLKQLGFNVHLAPDVAQRIRSTEDPSRFIEALEKAVNNPRAKEWLMGVLQRHGLLSDNAPAPTPATHPQQPSQQQEQRSKMNANGNSGADHIDMPPEDRMSFHVYGGKSALCFNADITKGGVHTVALDGAMAVATRKYDWENKIRVQMTRQELPAVLAVLLGYSASCRFSNHGADKTKGFTIERQPGKFFVNVMQKDRPLVAVPMTDQDAIYVTGLFMRQLGKVFGPEYLTMLPFLMQRYGALINARQRMQKHSTT